MQRELQVGLHVAKRHFARLYLGGVVLDGRQIDLHMVVLIGIRLDRFHSRGEGVAVLADEMPVGVARQLIDGIGLGAVEALKRGFAERIRGQDGHAALGDDQGAVFVQFENGQLHAGQQIVAVRTRVGDALPLPVEGLGGLDLRNGIVLKGEGVHVAVLFKFRGLRALGGQIVRRSRRLFDGVLDQIPLEVHREFNGRLAIRVRGAGGLGTNAVLVRKVGSGQERGQIRIVRGVYRHRIHRAGEEDGLIRTRGFGTLLGDGERAEVGGIADFRLHGLAIERKRIGTVVNAAAIDIHAFAGRRGQGGVKDGIRIAALLEPVNALLIDGNGCGGTGRDFDGIDALDLIPGRSFASFVQFKDKLASDRRGRFVGLFHALGDGEFRLLIV